MVHKSLKNQVVYNTNADYEKSFESIFGSPLFATHMTEKGLLWFKFKKTQTIFTLSSRGTMQVVWNSLEEKKILYKIVESVLIAKDGGKLTITPDRQQAWISYPPPADFKLWWCDETTEYKLKNPLSYSQFDHTLAINHSKNLVYGLDALVFLASLMPETFKKWKETPTHPKQREISILTDAAEEHLKTGYPYLYAEIVQFRKLICEEEKVTAELQKKAYFEVDSYGPSGMIGRYLTSKKIVEKKYRKKFDTLPKEKLETIKEIHWKETEQIIKLDREMAVLALQIENGEPLHGTCNLCPTIKVAA